MKPILLQFLAALVLTAVLPAQNESAPRFVPHEIAFVAAGSYANPYVEVSAVVTLTLEG